MTIIVKKKPHQNQKQNKAKNRGHFICIIAGNDTAKTDFHLAAIPLRTCPASPNVVVSQQLLYCHQVLPSRPVFLYRTLQVGKLVFGNINNEPSSALKSHA